MPGFFSNIPVLSTLPNPLNLFNNDDSPPDSPSRNVDSPSRIVDSPSSTMQSGSSRPTPILGSADPNHSMRKASGASIVIADSDTGDSDSPRSNRADGRARGLSVASAITGSIEGRPRGLSSVSAVSGATGDSGRRRRNRVETFVLVKPPPTTAKNPLNLQVQLVVNEKKTRPRRGSDAASRAAPPNEDLSSTPSTPQRGSYEMGEEDTEKTPVMKTPGRSATAASIPATVADTPASEAGEPATPTNLKRSNSVGSNRSSIAGSAASTASSASGKRIIPLYNLAVHNVVQPTIVTDAGTDSRVAKFSKRQLDIAGVGILEPAEIWLPYAGQPAGSPRPSSDAARGRPASMISNMSSLTPATSRAEDMKRPSMDVKLNTVLSPQDDGPKKFFGKIFRKRNTNLASPLEGRNSKDAASRSTLIPEGDQPSSLQIPASPQMNPQVHFPIDASQVGHSTFGLAPSVMARRMSETIIDESGAIVGIANEIVPDPNMDQTVSLMRSARPIGYTWTVRRWAKKNTDGWAAHLVAAAAAGLDLVGGTLPGEGSDDVVFEWVKLRVSPNGPGSEAVLKNHLAADQLESRRKRSPASTNSARESPATSRTNLTLNRRKTTDSGLDDSGTVPTKSKSKIFRRPTISSVVRRNSRNTDVPIPEVVVPSPPSQSSKPPSTTTTSSGSPVSAEDDEPQSVSPPIVDVDDDDDDDDYDSDPEDSETPWQCSVWVKTTGQRQLIATLTPAPHHPKVIGILRIPTGVRSICLTDLGQKSAATTATVDSPSMTLAPAAAIARAGPKMPQLGNNDAAQPTSSKEVAQRVREEVALTEENIKDIVAVTAMWLVAREEFGGLGAKPKGKK